MVCGLNEVRVNDLIRLCCHDELFDLRCFNSCYHARGSYSLGLCRLLTRLVSLGTLGFWITSSGLLALRLALIAVTLTVLTTARVSLGYDSRGLNCSLSSGSFSSNHGGALQTVCKAFGNMGRDLNGFSLVEQLVRAIDSLSKPLGVRDDHLHLCTHGLLLIVVDVRR